MGTLRVVTLYVISVYLASFGVLFLFAPDAAEQLTRTTHHPTLSILYGQYTLTFAYVSFMAAREDHAATPLWRTIVILTAGHVVVFGYLLVAGVQRLAQAGPPLIVNAALMILLLVTALRTAFTLIPFRVSRLPGPERSTR